MAAVEYDPTTQSVCLRRPQMTASQSFRHTPFWRLARVRMAGVVLLVQVLTAAVFLALSGLAREQDARDAAEARVLVDAARQASAAQAEFKAQVQEWKNILLRGSDEADFARYRDAMRYRAGQFVAALGRLGASGADITDFPVGELQALADEATALLADYEASLGQRASLTAGEARLVDARLRGIDRVIEERVDQLTDRLLAKSAERQRDAVVAARERASRLGTVVLAGLALSIAAVFLLLLMSLRTTS